MTFYSIGPRTRKCVRGHEFVSFARKLSDKYREKVLDTATKKGLDDAKTTFKKLCCRH